MITDYNGVMTYTETVSEDMQKFLNLLQVDGKMFTGFFLELPGQSEKEWLESIQGVSVVTDPKTRMFEITKTSETVVVPALTRISIKNSTPPIREYALSLSATAAG